MGTEAVAGVFLIVLFLAFVQNVQAGTAREWLAGKFLNRGEAPPEAPLGGLPGPGVSASGFTGTARFGDPVPAATLISVWGDARDGGARTHAGNDLAAPRGTPIYSAAAGTVKYATTTGRCGLGVSVDHGGGWRTVYCHLEAVSVAKGQTVVRGQRLGSVGTSGNAAGTTPHLHFEIRKNDQAVNPQALYGR